VLKLKMNGKTFLTIIVAAFVVAVGFAGGRWKVGYADGASSTSSFVPTIPIVNTIFPDRLPVNSPNTLFTLTGSNFIDTQYTRVRWLGPDSVLYEAFPQTVSADGTTLTITLPSMLFLTVGTAEITVINHPDSPGQAEISGTFSVTIFDPGIPVTGETVIYLPVIMR